MTCLDIPENRNCSSKREEGRNQGALKDCNSVYVVVRGPVDRQPASALDAKAATAR